MSSEANSTNQSMTDNYIPTPRAQLQLQEEVNRLREVINRYDDAVAEVCPPADQDAIMELIEEFRQEDEDDYGDSIL